ncbi:methionine sulfoxide reductase A [Ramaria rubella]|nr:methionine sulfoxide reductase A [Ramaria rubella]
MTVGTSYVFLLSSSYWSADVLSFVEIATFANGCFWGTEHMFLKAHNKGIIKTSVGYTGGRDDVKNPSYQDVCSGRTGHAEAVRIEFDPAIIKYEELVEFFYRSHDPTTKNRQGNDAGTQYRSAIFTHSDEQVTIAQSVTAAIQAKHFDSRGRKIATTIEPAKEWYPAESYHQAYLFKNPHGYQCPTHRLHW